MSGTFITACSGPAEAAATVASGDITSAAVAAVAAMETAEAEPARGAAWNQTPRRDYSLYLITTSKTMKTTERILGPRCH